LKRTIYKFLRTIVNPNIPCLEQNQIITETLQKFSIGNTPAGEVLQLIENRLNNLLQEKVILSPTFRKVETENFLQSCKNLTTKKRMGKREPNMPDVWGAGRIFAFSGLDGFADRIILQKSCGIAEFGVICCLLAICWHLLAICWQFAWFSP